MWKTALFSRTSRNCSPALRSPIMAIARAHSATPYDDPLVVSTVRMPRCQAASVSIRLAKRSPSSSPTKRRFGQASMISPVIRGEPMLMISASASPMNSMSRWSSAGSGGGGSM